MDVATAIGSKARHPGFVEPALATSVDKVPSARAGFMRSSSMATGFRCISPTAQSQSSDAGGNDWTKRFGKIAADAFEVNADRRSSMVRMVRPLSRERTAPPTFCPAKRIEGRARPFDFALSQRLRLAKADVGRAQGTARVTCRRIRTCSSAIVSRLTAAKWTSIRVRSGLRASSLRCVTAVMCVRA